MMESWKLSWSIRWWRFKSALAFISGFPSIISSIWNTSRNVLKTSKRPSLHFLRHCKYIGIVESILINDNIDQFMLLTRIVVLAAGKAPTAAVNNQVRLYLFKDNRVTSWILIVMFCKCHWSIIKNKTNVCFSNILLKISNHGFYFGFIFNSVIR